jgi:hypothetical protein
MGAESKTECTELGCRILEIKAMIKEMDKED